MDPLPSPPTRLLVAAGPGLSVGLLRARLALPRAREQGREGKPSKQMPVLL